MKFALNTLRSLWSSRQVRGQLLITLALMALFRFFAHVPLVGVDIARLEQLFSANQFLGIINLVSGGTLARFSIMAVGMSPYITASILFQVAGLFIPQIKTMQRESEATRAQLNQWMRLATVPVAVMQSLSLLLLLRSQGLLLDTSPLAFVAMITSLVTGAVVVMWMGELLTKHGIGNGMSWIILVGVLSAVPSSLAQTWSLRETVAPLTMGGIALGFLVVLLSVVFVQESVRRIPVQQAKRLRGDQAYGGAMSHIPVKVNQFGVMPIIFALPLLALPTTVATLVLNLNAPAWLDAWARSWQIWFAPGATVYNVLYFVFVFAFTFFSILVYFNPKDFAEDLKKSGVYVPGVRPGKPTSELLLRILLRVSFLGGLFLGMIALLPLLAQRFTGLNTLTVGGTGLLIVVSVILEALQQAQSKVIQDKYDQYLE